MAHYDSILEFYQYDRKAYPGGLKELLENHYDAPMKKKYRGNGMWGFEQELRNRADIFQHALSRAATHFIIVFILLGFFIAIVGIMASIRFHIGVMPYVYVDMAVSLVVAASSFRDAYRQKAVKLGWLVMDRAVVAFRKDVMREREKGLQNEMIKKLKMQKTELSRRRKRAFAGVLGVAPG